MENTNDPLISIMIPTYNRASYLDDCLYSVLVQDYKNCEIFIRDNNSSDNTKEIIDKYRPLFNEFSDFRYKKNDFNEGYRDNMINGTKESNGKYCLILMDDDFLCSSNAVSSMVEALQSSKNVSLTVSSIDTYIQGKMELSVKEIIDNGKKNTLHSNFRIISGNEYFLNSWTVYKPLTLSSIIFDRDKLLASPWEQWTENPAIDVNLYHAISPGNNIALIEDTLAYYRLHETQDINVFPLDDATNSHSRILLWYEYAKQKKIASKISLFIWRLKTVMLKDTGPIRWLNNRKKPQLNNFFSWLKDYNYLHYFIIKYFNPQVIKYDNEKLVKKNNTLIIFFNKVMIRIRNLISKYIIFIDKIAHDPSKNFFLNSTSRTVK